MTKRNRMSRHLIGRASVVLAAGLVLGLGLAAPSESLATPRHKSHKTRVHHHRGHGPVVYYGPPVVYRGPVAYRPLPVPRRIYVGAEVSRFRPYYGGAVYFSAHGHYHPVYNFPVYVSGGWVARPHQYCDGHLYGRFNLSFRGDDFSVAVGW